MAFTVNQGFPTISALLGTGVSTLYTVPATAQSSKPQKVTVVNTSGSTRTVDIYMIKNGDTAAAKNQMVVARQVPANSSIDIPELVNQTLMPGDFIQAKADNAGALNITGSILETYES